MPVNLIQYRGAVGSFNNRHSARELKYRNLSLRNHYHNIFAHCFFCCNSGFLFVLILTVFLVIKHSTCNGTKNSKALSFFVIITKIWIATWLYSVLLLLGGDVELNPGPKQSSINAFSICHWNLNSLSAHNYAKIFLLKAYMICIAETCLDSSTSPDDNDFEISRYNLIQSNHPSDNKRGGICIYYKHFLPLRLLNVQYLQECINFEMKFGDKVCKFISLYRSPSQTLHNFENSKNFELNLENIVYRSPFQVVVIGDFNAKSSKCHCQDKSTFE